MHVEGFLNPKAARESEREKKNITKDRKEKMTRMK